VVSRLWAKRGFAVDKANVQKRRIDRDQISLGHFALILVWVSGSLLNTVEHTINHICIWHSLTKELEKTRGDCELISCKVNESPSAAEPRVLNVWRVILHRSPPPPPPPPPPPSSLSRNSLKMQLKVELDYWDAELTVGLVFDLTMKNILYSTDD
jgi:hypothetical protein